MSQFEKILILDENESNVLFFEMLLQEMERKFKVYTASTGAQAEVVVQDEGVQMVICAWEMSAMPGTVFIQRIREDRRRRYMPCIIFSKRMNDQDIALAKELGFENMLGMPFDKKVASDMITALVTHEEELPAHEKTLRRMEVLISEGQITEALKMINPALTRKKEYRPRALCNLAEIWLASAQAQKAEKTIGEVLKQDPDYLPAQRLLARAYSMLGRHEEAIATLVAMSERSPKNIKTLLALGAAYVDANHTAEAREVFKRAGDIDPDHQGIKDEQGKLALKEGDYNLAAQLLAETQSGDEVARYSNSIAITHVAAGRFDEGMALYEQAIRILRDKARLHQLYYNLGLACKKKGDLEASFKKLCESYVASPSFEKAYVALAKVAREMKAAGTPPSTDLVGEVRNARTKFKSSQAPAA